MNTKYPLLEACNPMSCHASRIMVCERLIANIYRKHLSIFKLTNSQMVIMMVLAKKGETTQSELGAFIHLEKSSLSRNLRRLFQSKYVERVEKRQLSITDHGKMLLETLIPAWNAAKHEVNELLGEEGQQALNTITVKLQNKN